MKKLAKKEWTIRWQGASASRTLHLRNERVASWFGARRALSRHTPSAPLHGWQGCDVEEWRRVSSRKPSCSPKSRRNKAKIWRACPEEPGLAGIPLIEQYNQNNNLKGKVLVISYESKPK
jgi:hypothetical protein